VPDQMYNVLFLCTGNSARSVLAESILRKDGAARFQSFSAGSTPKGTVHPLALRTLESMDYPADGMRSKSWLEFAASDAPVMDFVFTVCDDAAGEICPVWPGRPVTAHWAVEDPSRFRGTDDEIRHKFATVANLLKRRIELLTSLPLAKLDRIKLQHQVRDIGKR